MQNKTKVVLAVLGTGAAAAVLCSPLSYITAGGDESVIGVRAARKLGIKHGLDARSPQSED